MRKVADYVREAKRALGDVHMSDRALGEHLGGYKSSTISNARYGEGSDHVAVALAKVLKIEPGEVLLIARAERERDPVVRKALVDFAKKVVASVHGIAVNAVGATIVALGLSLPTPDAHASVGGVGRI